MFNKTLPSSFWSLGDFSVKCEGWWYLNASTVVFNVFMSDPGDTRDLSTIGDTLEEHKLGKLLTAALKETFYCLIPQKSASGFENWE